VTSATNNPADVALNAPADAGAASQIANGGAKQSHQEAALAIVGLPSGSCLSWRMR
jgi:hypothetical protein